MLRAIGRSDPSVDGSDPSVDPPTPIIISRLCERKPRIPHPLLKKNPLMMKYALMSGHFQFRPNCPANNPIYFGDFYSILYIFIYHTRYINLKIIYTIFNTKIIFLSYRTITKYPPFPFTRPEPILSASQHIPNNAI